jgi:hypothetical protein
MTATVVSIKPAVDRRNELRRKWRDAFDDGARCAFLEEYPAERELGGYPKGFHSWPLDKRSAWFSGFNLGLIDRTRFEKEARDG